MKKFIMILLLVVVATISYSQTKVIGKTSGNLTAGEYVYLWGSTADTLTNADTLTYTLRVRGDQTFDIKAQPYIDFVSGTATQKIYTYNSIDGTHWSAKTADSLTISGNTADAMHPTALYISDVMDVYKKIVIIQAGSGKNVPKLFIVTRKN